ncbi:hypothetical protein, partial [Kitasatospora arboriphila]
MAVTAAAAVALTLSATNTASAADFVINEHATSSDAGGCGVVGWSQYGDVFRFMDLCKDGKGVEVEWTTPTKGLASTSDAKHTHNYTGGYTGWEYLGSYDLDFPEGACFYFRAG